MQTFTVKVTGHKMTAREIRESIWMNSELSNEEIIVTEN